MASDKNQEAGSLVDEKEEEVVVAVGCISFGCGMEGTRYGNVQEGQRRGEGEREGTNQLPVGVAPEREGKHGTRLLRSAVLRGRAVAVAVGGRRKEWPAMCFRKGRMQRKGRRKELCATRAGVRQRGWAGPLGNWLTDQQ